MCEKCDGLGFVQVSLDEVEVGREKLDALLDWYKVQYNENPNLKLIVWCRFRSEVERTIRSFRFLHPEVEVGSLWGQQTKQERDYTLRLLKPGLAPAGPVVVVGTPQTGAMGLDMAAASVVVFLSNDRYLKVRMQSEDRPHGPGQTQPVAYYDIVAEGPKGQATIDHVILKQLRAKKNLADITVSAWRSVIMEEN
jgi:hypothetical protein